jgi:branched-subunit amino acid ABC-type transport system permease component
MELFGTSVVNMLVLSSMYILMALGFALLFSIMGILNFAHGAIYMVGGYICYQFAGEYGLTPWVSLLLSVLLMSCFGLFLERFFFRPFFGNMNRTIVVCIALIVILETTVNIAVGTYVRSIPSFGAGILKLAGLSLSLDKLITFLTGGILLLGMVLFINKTKLGEQMQAVAQDVEGAVLHGVSVNRISALACFIACGLAAVSGSLMGAVFSLSPFMGDYMLVKAVELVILGGIGSIGGILFAGLIIGGLDATLPLYVSGATSEAIGLGIIILLLLFRPQGFLGHEVIKEEYGTVERKEATGGGRRWTVPISYGALFLLFALFPLVVPSPYWIHVIIMTFVYIVATASLRTITISGQQPLAHAAFMGIGAYVSAVLGKELGWSPWLTIPIGGLTSMVVGAFIGYPFARLRAIYYAMVSLFFGIGVIQVFFVFQKWTQGMSGLVGIPPLFGEASSKLPHYYFFLAFTTLCLLVLYRFEFSRIGTTLRAIEQSHSVASSVGINEARYRVLALAAGSFFVGLTGAAYAHYNEVLSYTSFTLLATLWLFMYALIGGIESFAGPIIGTLILVLLPEMSRGLKTYSPFLSAAILLVVAYLLPGGLAGLPQALRSRRRRPVKETEETGNAGVGYDS